MSKESEPIESDRPATDGNHLDINRRRLLEAGIATTAIAAGGVSGIAAAEPSEDDWDDLTLRQQLNAVRKATNPYKQLENMGDAGYVSSPIPVVCSEGYHFDKLPLWDDQLDPERPESLFYMVNEGGKLKLGGAEFILITDLDENGDPVDPMPDLFNDEGESLERPPLRGTAEADGWNLFRDTETGTVFWDLHVWVHERNPEGVFSLPNPRYADIPGCVPLEELPFEIL